MTASKKPDPKNPHIGTNPQVFSSPLEAVKAAIKRGEPSITIQLKPKPGEKPAPVPTKGTK